MKKLINSRVLKIIAVIIIVGLSFIRVINLDQDLPPWGIAYYQPADEGQYAMMAINEESFGDINPARIEGEEYITNTTQNFITNIIGTGLGILGFKLFGDNYWGLRLPYVFVGLLNLLAFGLILLKIKKKYAPGDSKSDWLIIGLLLWHVFDFCFFFASRVVEPSSLRMLFAQLVLLVYLKMPNSERIRYFLMGTIITASVFLLYITNVFLYLAVGFTLIYIWKQSGFKIFLKNTLWFVFGFAVCFVVAEAYYYMAWNTTAITNTIETVKAFSSTHSYEILGATKGLSFAKIIKEFFSYFSANALLYNLPVLLGFILGLPLTVYLLVKKKSITVCLIVSVVVAFLMQTIVSNDYIIRKFIVVMPYMIFLLLVLYYKRSEWVKMKERVFTRCKPWPIKLGSVILYGLTLLFISYVFYLRIRNNPNGAVVDVASIDKYLIFVFGYIPIALVLLKLTYNRIVPKHKRMNVVRTVSLLLVATCCLNVSLLFRYAWSNPTFTERDAMIDLGEVVDDQYVFGVGYQYGFSLYNTMKPIADSPDVLRMYLNEKTDALLFDYADDFPGMRAYFDDYIYASSDVTALPIHTVERTFRTFGLERDMCVYITKPKDMIIEEYQQKYIAASALLEELSEVDLSALSEEEREEYYKAQALLNSRYY